MKLGVMNPVFGGYTFEVIATPGHTKGSLSLLLKEKNWLYVGDAANGFLWLFMPDATDRNTYVSTLDKIITKDYFEKEPYRCSPGTERLRSSSWSQKSWRCKSSPRKRCNNGQSC